MKFEKPYGQSFLFLTARHEKPGASRLCENALTAVPANAPTCSGRLLLCSQQTKKGVSAHQRHHLA
ncbi:MULTISPECIES: hypothetical protein, partial [unclassified Pseudomonas]|uniref:hypothetical protein n=1 Tax=unclassified Pseudomonas TaxID=196821 RepID=UPI00249C69F0